jgi:hypothetical protein
MNPLNPCCSNNSGGPERDPGGEILLCSVLLVLLERSEFAAPKPQFAIEGSPLPILIVRKREVQGVHRGSN